MALLSRDYRALGNAVVGGAWLSFTALR